jgi:uncharacterized membrane protein YdjX (TVP38/TMEM64 family)
MFGVFAGGFLMCVACTVGSVVNFLLGRFVFAQWARRKLRESPMLSALESVLNERAASIIFLARLSPVFPMALFGYVVGATSVSLTTYTVATFVGLLPGCVLYAWIGAAAGSGAGWSSMVSITISVVSTVVISFKAKQLVDEALARQGPNKTELTGRPNSPSKLPSRDRKPVRGEP